MNVPVIASSFLLTMTKNRAAYYQHIIEPFFLSFSLFFPAKLGWDLTMTTGIPAGAVGAHLRVRP
jgi:hypothetical protein